MANKYTPLRCPYCGGKLYTTLGFKKHVARCKRVAVALVANGKGR